MAVVDWTILVLRKHYSWHWLRLTCDSQCNWLNRVVTLQTISLWWPIKEDLVQLLSIVLQYKARFAPSCWPSFAPLLGAKGSECIALSLLFRLLLTALLGSGWFFYSRYWNSSNQTTIHPTRRARKIFHQNLSQSMKYLHWNPIFDFY